MDPKELTDNDCRPRHATVELTLACATSSPTYAPVAFGIDRQAASKCRMSGSDFTASVETAPAFAGRMIRDLRHALRWSQLTLATRAGVSQSWVSRVERGECADVSIAAVERLLVAMGARLILDASAPFLAMSRQRDAVHARCTSQVARRLEASGWEVATEVEVGGDRSRGWIDVLAWHPETGWLLVIEVKTELRDLGAIERSLNWYEREAWAAARRQGWRPRVVVGSLLLLATDAVDARVRDNRDALSRSFPTRARDLATIVTQGSLANASRARAIALIDPRSRRRVWLRPTRVDGRRSPAPYADYADFVRKDVPRRNVR